MVIFVGGAFSLDMSIYTKTYILVDFPNNVARTNLGCLTNIVTKTFFIFW